MLEQFLSTIFSRLIGIEYDFQLLGIILDIFGTYYLLRGLIFKTPIDIKSETYGDPNPNLGLDLATSGNDFVSRLIQREEARIGFGLLLIGFIFQGLGIVYPGILLSLFLTILVSISALLLARLIHSKKLNLQRLIKIHDEETTSMKEDTKLDFKELRLKFKNIEWRRKILFLLLVVLPPLVFSWPLLPDGRPFPSKNLLKISITESDTNINISELPKELPLEGTSGTIGGRDFFSSVLKVKTNSMPIELCFNNYNKILEDGKEVRPESLIDAEEAGAMSVKYLRLDNNTEDEIYVKRGETNKCKILPAEGVALINGGPEIRSPLPIKIKARPEKGGFLIDVEPRNLSVAVYLTPGFYHIQWQKYIFIKNFIQLFFAWLVILMICGWAWERFSNPKKTDQS